MDCMETFWVVMFASLIWLSDNIKSSVDAVVFAVFGTRSIPHTGHLPGPSCTTFGCIGQVYFVAELSSLASVCPACSSACFSWEQAINVTAIVVIIKMLF